MLFFSNYGGSWESYLEDFITLAHGGLTGVWSNTEGFPRTKNLIQDGATDSDRFKRWARRSHYPSRFWYSAYPDLNTERIRRNCSIRHGLATATSEDEAAKWLSLFGSEPPRPDTLETEEIQTIMFGGMGSHIKGSCFVAKFTEGEAEAKRWLKALESKIEYGNDGLRESVTQIAFTAGGLTKLGLDGKEMDGFPMAFSQGPARRSDILGDIKEDSPENWSWGGDSDVDAVVLLYDMTTESHKSSVDYINTNSMTNGVDLEEIGLLDIDKKDRTEHFGFVDGVSQPIIRGVGRAKSSDKGLNIVEPGEFILGYHNNRGYFPHSPKIPVASDHNSYLANARVLADSDSDSESEPKRDFGLNGSYLVVRQLEQNVPGFNKFVSQKSASLNKLNHDGVPNDLTSEQLEIWLKAKMVGRWPDGTSLIRYPNKPGKGWKKDGKATPDNSFHLGQDDPLGHKVPLGSHIRRTNPRDSFNPGSDEQMSITNRHRILRRGRLYGERFDPKGGDEKEKRGLLFMCLNSDIERQFEFIQQSWMLARRFQGLDAELDPVVGRGGVNGRFTIPTPHGPVIVSGIQRFVSVCGSGYFFLPSRRSIRYLAN